MSEALNEHRRALFTLFSPYNSFSKEGTGFKDKHLVTAGGEEILNPYSNSFVGGNNFHAYAAISYRNICKLNYGLL